MGIAMARKERERDHFKVVDIIETEPITRKDSKIGTETTEDELGFVEVTREEKVITRRPGSQLRNTNRKTVA